MAPRPLSLWLLPFLVVAALLASLTASCGETPASNVGMTFGSSYESTFLDLAPSSQAAVMNRIHSTGVGWMRLDVSRDGGRWWSEPIIRATLAAGMKVDALLTDFDDVLGSPSEVAAFAADAAAKYGPLGVHVFEIGNELNYNISAAQYTGLLKASYRAVKAVDSSATVLVGGLGPAAGDKEPSAYLAGMYAAGVKGYFSAMAVHPYSYPDLPMQPDDWNAFYNLPRVHQVMVDNGDGSKKIWLNEYGAPTFGDPAGNGSVTEQHQAQEISEAFAQAAKWSWAGPLFVFSWKDSGDGAFGMLRGDGTAKPALAALAAV